MNWISHPNSTPFHDQYVLEQHLGEGSYAQVRECTDKVTGEAYACKIISKASISSHEERNNIVNEVLALRRLHKLTDKSGLEGASGILKLRDIFETEEEIFVVTEICRGGTLFDLVTVYGPLPESTAKLIFQQLLTAVIFCHSQGILHRDIKPENILFADTPLGAFDWSPYSWTTLQNTVRLADFGFATPIHPGTCLQGFAGNLWYTAPEIHQRRDYGLKADVWSLGVVLFFMLTGQLPFPEGTEDEMYQAVVDGKVSWDKTEWKQLSWQVKKLLRKMLQQWPSWRSSAKELSSQPWLREQPLVSLPESCAVSASKSGESTIESSEEFRHCSFGWMRLWGRVK